MMEAMRKLYLMGGTWQSVIPQLEHLLFLLAMSALLLLSRLYYYPRSAN